MRAEYVAPGRTSPGSNANLLRATGRLVLQLSRSEDLGFHSRFKLRRYSTDQAPPMLMIGPRPSRLFAVLQNKIYASACAL